MMSRKGSLVLEYSVLIAVALVALLIAQMYMRRALSGRWRQVADVFGGGRQFDPQRTRVSR